MKIKNHFYSILLAIRSCKRDWRDDSESSNFLEELDERKVKIKHYCATLKNRRVGNLKLTEII